MVVGVGKNGISKEKKNISRGDFKLISQRDILNTNSQGYLSFKKKDMCSLLCCYC
jgi:hypothetical protein